MNRELSRWGVGPSILVTAGTYAAIAGLATYLWPNVCLMPAIPYWCLLMVGILLLLIGVPMLMVAGKAAMFAYNSDMPNHMAELGSGNFDQELTLSLLGSEKEALDQIEAAIERIEDGSCGHCETCGEKIPKSRLEAIPYAALCVRCASQREEAHITEMASTKSLNRRSPPTSRIRPNSSLRRSEPPMALTVWATALTCSTVTVFAAFSTGAGAVLGAGVFGCFPEKS